MKKKLLFTATAALFFTYADAQNAIPNAGFESWSSQGSYDDCAGWGTIDQPVSSACFCKGTAVKTAVAGEVHSGSLAMKLKTVSVFGQTAPGITATGSINQSTQGIDGGVVFNLRPDSIVGWYRYTPSGTDTGSVEITLSKWNTGTNKRDVVAHAKFAQNTSVASYSRFAQPLTYSLSGAPDTMVVILLSSSSSAPQVNSTMFVDDLGLIYNSTTGIAGKNLASTSVSVYPNPSTGNITIKSASDLGMVFIYNALGEIVYKENISGTQHQIDISKQPEGIYMLQAQGNYTRLIKE
jgi:hypothetical protein